MSSDLTSKCRTCLSDSNFFRQLIDYVDENYKILEMLESIVPQIDIKCNNTQFSTVVCQPCVDKLVTGYKFQQLCVETNNRLHELLGIAVFETEPKVEKTLDPLTGENNLKMKAEMDDEGCYEREINSDELLMTMESDHENDWEPLASDSDTNTSNEKLTVVKETSAKKASLKEENPVKLNKIKIRMKSFPCKECGKVLSNNFSLKRHETLLHTERTKYPCETCNATFATEKTLKAHMLAHEVEQNCRADVKSDQNEANDEINYTKEFVYSKDNDEEDSKENMEDLDSKDTFTFQCTDCPKSFDNKASLSNHYKVHRKKNKNKLNNKDKKIEPKVEENEKPDQTIDDEEPNVFIKEEFEITPQIFEEPLDEFKRNGDNKNSDCDNMEKNLFAKPVGSTKNKDYVDTGTGKVEKPKPSNKRSGRYPCEVCGKMFDRAYPLKRHSVVHSLTRPHECKVCKYRFVTMQFLKAHLCQNKDGAFSNLSDLSRPEGFQCPDCPRRFEKRVSLAAHRQIHTRNGSGAYYACMVCQCNYMSERSLNEHITNKHPEKVKHNKCDQCDKTFVLHAHLVEHMRTHCGENPYLCPECGKTYRSASNLSQHMDRHKGLKRYQCSECPSRFNCRSDLSKHKLTHTNIKPHVCDKCGSRFKNGYSLQKHKRLHAGVRPIKCDQCSMSFAIAYQLRIHMRTHTGEKPYKCKYCELAYAQSGDLTKHLRTHVGENIYICDQCPMSFKYQAELRQHKSEHYKMAQKQQQPEISDSQLVQLNEQQLQQQQ